MLLLSSPLSSSVLGLFLVVVVVVENKAPLLLENLFVARLPIRSDREMLLAAVRRDANKADEWETEREAMAPRNINSFVLYIRLVACAFDTTAFVAVDAWQKSETINHASNTNKFLDP